MPNQPTIYWLMNIDINKTTEARKNKRTNTSNNRIQSDWNYQSAKDLDQAIPGCIDSIGLLSGVANTIMQLSYPGVGHGVMESKVESGSILHHPFKRGRTTLTYLAVAMHGTKKEKLAYRRAINKVHAQVISTENSPIKYRALDPQLQLWVAACLFWGYLDVYEKFREPMSPENQEIFYQMAKPLGTTLQVKDDMWPDTVEDFWKYWNDTLKNLDIPKDVAAWLEQLIDFTFLGPAFSIPLGGFAKLMTTGFLHPNIREQIGLPWGPIENRKFNMYIKSIAKINNAMPRVVRQLPGSFFMWDFRRRIKQGIPLN